MSEEKETVEPTQPDETNVNETQSPSESQPNEENTEISNVSEEELSALKNELQDQKDKYLRLFAEFDSFKKRSAKDRLELFKTAGQDIIRELLPVLDDFQRAQSLFQQDNNKEIFTDGTLLIIEKFQKTLLSKGLKPIESIGKEFNVEQHEAIAEVPAPSEEMKGKIMDEIQSGYTLNDVIIRYAKVVVGN